MDGYRHSIRSGLGSVGELRSGGGLGEKKETKIEEGSQKRVLGWQVVGRWVT